MIAVPSPRVGAIVALAILGALIPTGAQARTAPSSPLTDPAQIEELAAQAYVWGLAPEFVYRFSNYNTLLTAPLNGFGGRPFAAAWNNNATNAGNASVLYVLAMLDLSGKQSRGGTRELVLTVPPSAPSSGRYYVVDLFDAFINTVGSIGTRTTPSKHQQTYLLAGPHSRYANRRKVRIHGFRYRVLPYDTNLGAILIRIRADSLVPASDASSVASTVTNVENRFALTPLADFESNKHKPDYFQAGSYTPTSDQISEAAQWQNTPSSATAFFSQVGAALRKSPLPHATSGLGMTKLATLPSWVTPQAGAKKRYLNPSYGQRSQLARFRPLGLTAKGFTVPPNWGSDQLNALQAGYDDGHEQIVQIATSLGAAPATNFWGYLNQNVGTYPNTTQGYQYRAAGVIAGGLPVVPADAVYPTASNLDGTSATQLDGNNTYKLTFTPPVADPAQLPVIGTLPPTVNDSQGNPLGLWSIHIYQTDSSQAAAPFLSQTGVLNTAYSTPNIPVTGVDASTDTITVESSAWGPLAASTPILFGSNAASYGLTPGVPYFVAATPAQQTDPTTNATTYSFKVSTMWKQPLSAINVPVQGTGGAPGPIADLTDPGGAVDLQWGPVQPVSQLGSQQLASGKLAKDSDGSVTIWIAPTLPAGAPATNWIPTPSTAYFAGIYPGKNIPTKIQATMRIYYPTPGSNTMASILPPPNGSMGATYAVPALQELP